MKTDMGTAAPGGTTLLGQAKALKEASVPLEDAVRRLMREAGLEETRARELVNSVYGTAARVAASPTARAVGSNTWSLTRSVVGGGAAAVLCAVAWASFTVWARWSFGGLAWLVGAAVGAATYYATPEEHRASPHLPIVAAALAIAAILIRRTYFTLLLPMAIPGINPLDIIWMILAVISAYKIAAQDQ